MKHVIYLFALVATPLLACINRQPQTISEKELNEAEKLPLEDKSFTDFFDAFIWNEDFQKSRTIFPFKKDNKTIQMANDWNYLPFYTASNYIPILSSDTLDKDVNTSKIGLFLIDFKREIADKYNFEKIDRKWFLQSSESLSINKVLDFEFINFFTKFLADSTFQMNHIHFPLLATLVDYDNDDYPLITKTIPLEDWKYWRVSINQLMVLSNIDTKNKYRTIHFRGVENGIAVIYTFEKINESWKLIEFEDYSM